MKSIMAIMRISALELIRGKTLVSVLLINFFLILVITAFGSVSIGDRVLVIKDFGLLLMVLSPALVATVSGSTLLHREMTQKTIHNILSKPAARSEFLIGKFLGLLSVCWIVIGLWTTMLALYASLFDGHFDLSLFVGAYYAGLEAIIICALALFFASIVKTPALSGVFVFALFMAGRGLHHMQIAGVVSWVLPQTYRFNIANELVYNVLPTFEHASIAFLYAITYATALLVMSALFFSRRDIG